MRDLKQSSTAQPLVFFMASASDGKTGATGLSPTVTLSKNGGAFASPAGAVSEIGNGFYKVAGNATDNNTLGPLLLHATAPGADAAGKEWSVVAYDPQVATNLGLSAIPTANPGAANGMFIAGENAATSTTGGLNANVTHWRGTAVPSENASGVPLVDVTRIDGESATAVGGVTFPNSTLASTTNITAASGVSLSDNAITAAKIAASALNGKGDWNIGKTGYTLTQAFPANFSLLSINASGHIARVVLTDTLTSYTGNTVQTGDAFARLGAPAGDSVSADIAAIKADTAAIGGGDGDVSVDHDTGGDDNLRYMYNGSGVDEARVRAFLKSDYDAGNRVVKGESITGNDGRWVRPMSLNEGVYVIEFDAPGYQIATQEVTVAG